MARGQIETPVIMVFAVVAGILVLLAVGWFVLRQQSNGDKERLLTSLKGISIAIDTAASTVNAEQNVSTLEELRYVCDETGPSLWYANDATRPLTEGVVFGPASMSGTVTIASAPLGGAYRVTNVVYLTSPQGNTNAGFPVADSIEPSVGTVAYGGGSEAVYIGPGLRAGAQASANAQAYQCGLMQALTRYRFVNAIQRERIRTLVQRYQAAGNTCSDLYDEQSFATIDAALTTAIGSKSLSIDDARSIASAEKQIALMNDNLVRASCATVS